MAEVGVRALKQNASAVLAQVQGGEVVTITDRGRPVALLSPLRRSRLDELVAQGLLRPARVRLRDLPAPADGPPLTTALMLDRDDVRY